MQTTSARHCCGYFTEYRHWILFQHLFFLIFIFRGKWRDKERKSNIYVREKHGSVPLACAPPSPHQTVTQACASTGNGTGDPSLCGTCPNHWAMPARAQHFLDISSVFLYLTFLPLEFVFMLRPCWIELDMKYDLEFLNVQKIVSV